MELFPILCCLFIGLNACGSSNAAEITCTAPDIPHGTALPKTEYQKHAVLQYQCDVGYKPRGETSRCTKYGWSVEPKCVEITCDLKETRFGTARTTPEGKTLFRVGETVQITCAERYRIFHSKKKVETFTCKPDGQWDSNPVCELIRCEVPRERRLSYPHYYFSGELKLDDRRNYWCLPGFKKMADQATCTEDGWIPDPLCAGSVCDPPNIPNAQIRNPDPTRTQYEISSTIVYNCDPGFEPEQQIQITCNSQGKWSGIRPCTENKRLCATPTLINGHIHLGPQKEETIYYTCNEGYKPFSGNWWGGARCTHGHWSDEPRCIRVEECGSLPSVAHGRVRKTNNPDEQSAEVECDPGFKPSHAFIRCVSGTWEKPACELGEHCVSPPKVKNAVIFSQPHERYSSGSHVVYTCQSGFTMAGNSKVFCENSVWDVTPTCEAFCPEPRLTIENGILIDETRNERKYLHGDTVHYKCDDGYEYRGETTAKCEINSWIYPKCIEKALCSKPTKNVQFVTLSDEKKNVFNNFDFLTYTCNKPYDDIPGGTLMCENKEWNGTFQCTSKICPPPPYIEDGDFNIESVIDQVITRVSYACQNYYVADTPKRFYRCLKGKWDTPPKCLKPCRITPDVLLEYNLQPVSDNYVMHSDKDFRLNCNRERDVFFRRQFVRATCSDGKLKIEGKCAEKPFWI